MLDYNKIKKFRKQSRMKQKEVSKALGLQSEASVSLIESGKRDLSAIQLYVLSKLFNKSMDDFFSE